MQQPVAAFDVIRIMICVMTIVGMRVPMLSGHRCRMLNIVDLAHDIQHRPHEHPQHQQQQQAAMQETLRAGGKADHCISLRVKKGPV
ncbi:MAG: hypothetical protein B7X39_05130 [Lysobacterales bacterium 14-68-21]|nr:MAG: hypothetical protein B7X39_05130 [Xanthomonadales bacterium 14-68-21]